MVILHIRKPKNNGSCSDTILIQRRYYEVPVATDGQDGNELQLESVHHVRKTFSVSVLVSCSERFQVLCLYLAKITEKLIIVCIPCKNNPLDIFLLVFQEHFVSEGLNS